MLLIRKLVLLNVNFNILFKSEHIPGNKNVLSDALSRLQIQKGVDMIRAEIGLKNRQIINETYSFRCFLIL